MATDSTIMDSNSFKPEDAVGLDESTQKLIAKRELLGQSYRLFYKKPLHFVKGLGTKLYTASGEEYLDAYNNIPSLGHSHPAVAEAVAKQLTLVNTHTRYLHEGIVDYASDLLSTLPDEINRIMFLLSGSEANDLAVRIAKAYSGGTGFLVTQEAYHGNTDLISALSPSIGASQALAIDARLIPTPDTYRIQPDNLGQWFVEQIATRIEDMNRHGIKFAGILLDSIFSSDGVFPHDKNGKTGWLKPVIEYVHDQGGVYIADEVQPGFTRTGDSFWGFERHGFVPDIVTMGKPMANGIACSGVAAKQDVLEAFSLNFPYFNTYAGSPVAMAAAQATLNAMRDQDTLGNVKRVGAELKGALQSLAGSTDLIGDVRGAGLFLGVEIIKPGSTIPNYPVAVELIEAMHEQHVLCSLCGPGGNVLKIRPPLVFSSQDVDTFVTALEASLKSVR